ncbi:MAG: cytochrome P450 [Actinobacteria bacterium]|nr:cytochrome P450 [Actinomycetota bacterium]
MTAAPAPTLTPALERIHENRRDALDRRRRYRTAEVLPPGLSTSQTLRMLLRKKVPSLEFTNAMLSVGSVGCAQFPDRVVYGLADPDLVWEVFVTRAADMHKGFALRSTRPLLGDGILTSEGEAHREHRRLVQPAFTRRQIAGYADAMVRRSNELVQRWEERDDPRIIVADEMSELTLEIVGDTILGTDFSQDAERIARPLSAVLDSFQTSMSPLWALQSRYPSRARRRIVSNVEALQQVIASHIASKQEQLDRGEDPADALATLLRARDPQTGLGMSAQQIHDEVITLAMAGHETTAMLLSWTWLALSQNRAVKDWVQEEWDRVVPQDSSLSMASMAELPRTRAVLNESLRVYPPAWAFDREPTVDLELGGYEIPAGSILVASQYWMHRDQRFWNDPSRFWPQRWLTREGEFGDKVPGVPRGAWFPFGFAGRKCIGDHFALTEATLALAIIGRRFELTPADPAAAVPMPRVTLRPRGGIPAIVSRR